MQTAVGGLEHSPIANAQHIVGQIVFAAQDDHGVVAALGWLLLIAPIQYFVFLVCGAPSRIATASSLRVYARLDGHKLKYGDQSDRDTAPEEWWDASMRIKPVTLASAFSAAALLLAGQVWKLI